MKENLRAGLTFCSVKATLAAGTTTTVSTTGATLYCINGRAYSRAALSNAATPTTDATTGAAFVGVKANEGSVFVHCFDKDGNLKVSQGEVVALDAGANFTTAPEFPFIPDTLCPFGLLILKVDSTGSTWTYGTSNQSGATGVTYTRVDVFQLPDRPITS